MARDKWIWAMWIFYEIGMETEREEVGKFLNDRGVLFWINRFSPKCDQYTEKQVKFPMKTYHIRISQFKSNNKTSWKTKPSYLLQDFHKDFPVPFPFTYFLCPFFTVFPTLPSHIVFQDATCGFKQKSKRMKELEDFLLFEKDWNLILKNGIKCSHVWVFSFWGCLENTWIWVWAFYTGFR